MVCFVSKVSIGAEVLPISATERCVDNFRCISCRTKNTEASSGWIRGIAIYDYDFRRELVLGRMTTFVAKSKKILITKEQ